MSHEPLDSIQEALAAKEFSNRKDAKKTAGRALGTVLEIITFYLLKDYGLAHNIAIERSLGEYANPVAAAVCILYDTRSHFVINGNEDTKGAPMSCAMIYYGDRPQDFGRAPIPGRGDRRTSMSSRPIPRTRRFFSASANGRTN